VPGNGNDLPVPLCDKANLALKSGSKELLWGFTMTGNHAMQTFAGATAVVTGGASGIGRALAEELARSGCEVVLADLQIELATEVASGICESGGKATAVHVDVTDLSALNQVAEDTFERTGRLDYFFNNVGIGIGGNVCHYSIEDWNRIVDVNLRGVINGVHSSYRIMMRQGFGHIVNTASMAGLIPSPGTVAYATTKYAIVGLSESLRAEASHLGVRVSVICPGIIRTPILEGGGKYGKMLIDIPPEKTRQMVERLQPMSPEVFAERALRLVAKNKAIIVVPRWWKMFWWIHRALPSLGISLSQRIFQNMQKQLEIA
jgi:NAD(P)-dependent dehydrogenase (short-subunit alcohol dehydrogenase family)